MTLAHHAPPSWATQGHRRPKTRAPTPTSAATLPSTSRRSLPPGKPGLRSALATPWNRTSATPLCAGHDLDGTEDSFATRVELDIEGNQRAVRDAIKHTEARDAAGNPVVVDDPLGRIGMRYAYDMLGNRIHQLSMEAGARWMLNDVAGKPIRAWDSCGHNFTTTYDALRRPVEQTVRGTIANGEAASDPRTQNRDIRGLSVLKAQSPMRLSH